MYAWLIETFGEQNALYVTYGAGAVGVLLLIWVLWFWTRRVSGGVFIHGGRGRKPRLAVVDAAAIDSHRRVVLVRRDDVEHLVMIGGHNDFVIERGIGSDLPAQAEEPASPAKEAPSPARGKRRREVTAAAAHEPPKTEKPVEKKVPPPQPAAPEAKSEPAPQPAPQPAPRIEDTQSQPVAAPEPPQKDLPKDYAEVLEEPPMRQTIQSAPLQAASIPAAYAEHADIEPEAMKHEPAFDIHPESAIETHAQAEEPASGFEDHVQTSIAEAEATTAKTPPANDGSLEDEMQKLLNELTRKK